MPNPPSTAAPPTSPQTQDVLDEPAPDVVAQVLRSKPAAAPAPIAVATAAPVPVDATLIDAITRIVTEMMETHVRESVTAAVRALAPRLVVSLPPDGADGSPQVRSRPTRRAKRVD